MDVTLPNGKVIRGVPEGTPKETIKAKAIAAGLALESDFPAGSASSSPETLKQESSLLGQIGDAGLEFAAGVNRGAAGLVDFAASLPNAVLELAGSDKRIPSAISALAPATTGNFMESGLARDVVRSAGEAVPAAVATGSALRQAAAQIPTMARPTATQGVIQQLGSSTAAQDAITAGISGAGSAVGREYGGDLGALAGAVGAPIGVGVLANSPKAIASALSSAQESSLIKEATPTISQLKETARGVYKEIDDLGAVIDSSRVTGLVRDLNQSVRAEGFNKRIHPKISAAIDEFNLVDGTNQPISNIDTLRKVAGSAAASIDPDEARLGKILTSRIDDFLDDLDDSALVGGQSANVGEKYKQARQLWRRARKAEDIEYAIDRARNQASGFENGLRVQFRSILNNKKKLKNYSKDEITAMQKVVQGGGVENAAKAIGKFGFSEGQAQSMLLGSLGVAGGAAIGGSAGAVAVPLIGQVSKNLAQKLTRNNADMVSQIVRQGADAQAIAKAYLRATPKNQRSAYELAELLLATKQVNIAPIKTEDREIKRLMSDAAILVNAAQSSANSGSSQKEEQR